MVQESRLNPQHSKGGKKIKIYESLLTHFPKGSQIRLGAFLNGTAFFMSGEFVKQKILGHTGKKNWHLVWTVTGQGLQSHLRSH